MIRALSFSVFLGFGTLLFAQTDAARKSEPGLIDSEQTDLPSQLWLNDTTQKMSQLMPVTRIAALPRINQIFMQLTLSQSSPALSDKNSEIFGAARLEYLQQLGALDAAEALAPLYDWSPDIIREQVETIALLSTRPEAYCTRLLKDEFKEIEHGMKVYCYVRNNQYDEAIANFNQLSPMLSTSRKKLLMRFLDLDEDDPLRDEPWVELPRPFDFVLDEAIGRPRGLLRLPPPYAYFSRESGITPRSDLEISEELVHLGALPAPVLFAAYRDNSGFDSGHTGGRAETIAWLDALDANSSEEDIERVISSGRERFGPADMEQLFAEESGSKLKIYQPSEFQSPSLQQDYIRIAILGGWSQANWLDLIDNKNPELMLAFLISHPDIDVAPSQIFSKSPLARILIASFFGGEIAPLEAKGFGEAIWQSLYVINDYKDHPDYQVSGAFQSLIFSGLEEDARAIAVALLLHE